MRFPVIIAVLLGIMLVCILAGAGCNETQSVSKADCPRQTRLLEDENYRLAEQVKKLDKELAELKDSVAQTRKEQEAQEEANATAMKFLMEKVAEADTENQKLREKIAEMERVGKAADR